MLDKKTIKDILYNENKDGLRPLESAAYIKGVKCVQFTYMCTIWSNKISSRSVDNKYKCISCEK